MKGRLAVLITLSLTVMLLIVPSAMAAISVTSMGPDHAYNGTTVGFCIVYGDFHHPTGAHVSLPTFQLVNGATTIDLTTTSILESTGGKAYVSFTIPVGAALGTYTLNASQAYEIWFLGVWWPQTDTASLTNAFTVQSHPPIITSTNPTSVVAGSGDLTLTVYGTYFFQQWSWLFSRQSVVRFNGANLPTTYNSPTVLTAVVPASALTTPGDAQVTVFNVAHFDAGDADSVSNQFPFTITAPTPTITALDPSSAVVGSPGFNLGVTGTSFVMGPSGAVVRWNGADLVTTRDSATHLTAAVPAAAIAAAGSATVTVRNGTAPGAPVSNALSFSIGNVVPSMTSISPTSVWAGYVRNDVTLTVTGSSFLSGAHVMLGATEKATTTFVSATQLTVPLLAADIATAGTINVGVKNPPPGGGLSVTTQPLAVQAETTDPTVSIAGADAAWHNSPVLLTFGGSDSQSGLQAVQFRCPPAVPSWTTETTYTVPVTTEGAITVDAQALDWCNRVGTASATVNIDTTKPHTDALNAVTVKKGKTATLKFRISEPADLSPSAKVVLKVKANKGGRTPMTKTLNGVPMNARQTYSFKVTFKKGSYKWYVYATDLAGNTQANIAKASFTVK